MSLKIKKVPIIFLASLLLIIASGVTFYMLHGKNASQKTTASVNTINYGAPTQQDQAETKSFKDNQQKQVTQSPSKPPTASDGRTQVAPIISYAGQYDSLIEVSAFIPGIFEDNGTCSLVMTNGTTTINRTTTGVKDATTTRCGTFSIASKDIAPKGGWSIQVNYSSATSVGSSGKTNIQVQ